MVTFQNFKVLSVLFGIPARVLQIRLRNVKAFCFRIDIMLVNYEQKAFEILDASVDASPSISKD